VATLSPHTTFYPPFQGCPHRPGEIYNFLIHVPAILRRPHKFPGNPLTSRRLGLRWLCPESYLSSEQEPLPCQFLARTTGSRFLSSSTVTMPTVYLLDYVAGNIRSLVNAIEKCGWTVEWIKSPQDVEKADVSGLLAGGEDRGSIMLCRNLSGGWETSNPEGHTRDVLLVLITCCPSITRRHRRPYHFLLNPS
jgi:hypothetical protein